MRLVNAGTARWRSSNIALEGTANSTVIDNAGVFDIQCDRQITANALLLFRNTGELRKSAGMGNANIDMRLINSGTVRDNMGRIEFGRGVRNQTPGQVFLNGTGMGAGDGYSQEPGCLLDIGQNSRMDVTGNFDMNGGTATIMGSMPSVALTVSGNLNHTAGITSWQGVVVNIAGALQHTAGEITLFGNLTAAGGLQIGSAGVFTGTGIIENAITNSGHFKVWSLLEVHAGFTQTSSGTLRNLDVLAHLAVTGLAALDGAFVLDGQQAGMGPYSLITWDSYSGAFASITIIPPPPMGVWHTSYNDPPGAFTLWAA